MLVKGRQDFDLLRTFVAIHPSRQRRSHKPLIDECVLHKVSLMEPDEGEKYTLNLQRYYVCDFQTRILFKRCGLHLQNATSV